MPDDDIARLYDFTATLGTINASDVDGELDQIISTINNKSGRGVANTFTAVNTFSDATGIKTNTVTERTAASGVTIDGLKVKDSHAIEKGQIYGLNLTWIDDDTVQIAPGWCIDDATGNSLIFSSTQNVLVSAGGENGRMSGITETGSLQYYLWAIGKTDGTVAGLLNTSATTIATYPTGYTLKRLIGAVYNNASSNLEKFYMRGLGNKRKVIYDVRQQELTSGAAATWTDIDLTPSIPSGLSPTALAWVNFAHTTNPTTTANDRVWFRTNGSSGAGLFGLTIRSDSTGLRDQSEGMTLIIPDASGIIEYQQAIASTNGAPLTNLYVLGYEFDL